MQDVVDAFVTQGHDVCTFLWDDIRAHVVEEYVSGDTQSGYVLVQDGTPGTNQLSYPKFEAVCGTHTHCISMRYGLWDGSEYDATRLKMIKLPVLKRHGMAGATIAVKNYIGFLTTADRQARFGDFSDLHNFFWGYSGGSDYGLLGRQLALIRRADLNIVDAIWVNPVDGWHREDAAVRGNVLLASTDPFAIDYYSSVYVLLPHMVPGSDWARNADARHHGEDFRGLLMTNENRARSKGLVDIIDLDDTFTAEQELAQFNAFVADASDQQDFTLSLVAEPDSSTVHRGESTAYSLSATIHGSLPRPVTLALAGLPSGMDAWFSANPIIPPNASQLSISTTALTEVGTYSMVVTGTSGTVSDTTDLILIVVSPAPSFTLSVSPGTHTTWPGQVVHSTVSITQVDGPQQDVNLAVVGLPTNVNATWSENPVAPGSTFTLTLALSSEALLGDHLLSIVGTAFTQVVTRDLELKVRAPPIYLPLVFG